MPTAWPAVQQTHIHTKKIPVSKVKVIGSINNALTLESHVVLPDSEVRGLERGKDA